ncbi:hypothetical protein BC833DRAFT_568589 [Globomyces pollinis-pini]|nr:hypothetical protein BC833DRAFT_568589 [Globomyces pollinis-pini]
MHCEGRKTSEGFTLILNTLRFVAFTLIQPKRKGDFYDGLDSINNLAEMETANKSAEVPQIWIYVMPPVTRIVTMLRIACGLKKLNWIVWDQLSCIAPPWGKFIWKKSTDHFGIFTCTTRDNHGGAAEPRIHVQNEGILSGVIGAMNLERRT